MSPFLEDYLDRDDLAEALRGLAGPLGDGLELPARVDEVGLVCPSVVRAAAELKQRWPDMKAFLLGEGSPSTFIEHGVEVPFTTRVGFGFYKGVILELAEPGIGSDIFGQTPNPEGKIVINHLGFIARGPELSRTDAGVKRDFAQIMGAHGLEKRVNAVLNLFGFLGHIHIFETRAQTQDVEIEFLDFRLFEVDGPPIGYPASVAGLIGWLQAHVGPKLLKLPSHQQLPP
ncbi:MAG: hypothetical protein QM756_25705 [Polyangiaceae bacterium]